MKNSQTLFYIPTFFIDKKVGKKSRRGDRLARSEFFLNDRQGKPKAGTLYKPIFLQR
jgi:hypothetical protein